MKARPYRWIWVPLLALAWSAQATTVAGISLPLDRGDLALQGAGLLRKGFIFKIYVGALYLENAAHAEQILSDVPKQIDIHYFHHTPKKYMIRAAEESLRQNLTEAQYQTFAPKIKQLHDAYLNGASGSCASLIYHPGKGLTYLFDNELIITIEGNDFANAYFNVWLGENPSSRTMKAAMLGGMGES